MPSTNKVGRALSGFITGHPLIVLAAFVVIAALLSWHARHFTIDASADTLLLKNNRDFIQTQLVNQRFSPQEFLLIAYRPKEADLFSDRTFSDLAAIRHQLLKMDRVQSVRTIRNVPLLVLADRGLATGDGAAQWTWNEKRYPYADMRDALKGHPIYENLLVNSNLTVTAIQVLFRGDEEIEKLDRRILDIQQHALERELTDEEEAQIATLREKADPLERELDRTRTREVEEVRAILAGYEDRADFFVGGVHVLSYQLIRIIRNDLTVFGGAIAAMICVILFVLFRRLRWVVIPIAACGCSVLCTMGLFGMLGLKTTVISSNFIALQLILTLAIVIHLIVQYREYHAQQPSWSRDRLVRETLHRKAAPCFYAGFTTSVGFASLLLSNIQPVITFGWMMIIAMFFSIAVSLILFPAIMSLLPEKEASGHQRFSGRLLDFFTGFSLKRGGVIAVATGLLLAGSVTGLFFLDVENSFLNYFRDSTRVHKELTFVDRELGGSTPLDLVYTYRPPGTNEPLILKAENVHVVRALQDVFEEREAVGKVLSLANFTELASVLMEGKPITEYELTAFYRAMSEELRDDLLGAFFAPEHNQVRLSVRIQDTTPGLDRADLLSGLQEDIEALGIAREDYMLTNLFVMYQDILQRLFRSQILTLGVVYAALTLMFFIVFRSIRVALIGITPNILSTLAILGFMGLMGIPLDLMTITIAAIAMGIAVDDTIHYVHRYLEELKNGNAADAVERSHHSVGFAILYTTLIIVLGFSLLAFSDFVPSVLFGLLTALAMSMALLTDLTVLPALLARFVTANEQKN